MAHLWILDDADDWTPAELDGDRFALRGDAPHSRVALRRLAEPPETWALLTDGHSELRVNGIPVPTGLAVLADRDEIRLPGFSAWFSTETTARVEPFPESGTRGFCPRCQQPIESGTPAVRCPACGLWHHASDALGCWTYAPTCTACPQETALDAGFRWTPEDL